MTTKNAPATPLPWKPHGEPRYSSVREATTDGAPRCVVRAGGSKRNSQDADYIVHACNAYPELVAALRERLKLDDSDTGPLGNARILLTKLGEGA